MACIIWYTKRQATVESAVFGADFVAMKEAYVSQQHDLMSDQDHVEGTVEIHP